MFGSDYRTQTGMSIDDLIDYALDMSEFYEEEEDMAEAIAAGWELNHFLNASDFEALIAIVNKFEIQEVAV